MTTGEKNNLKDMIPLISIKLQMNLNNCWHELIIQLPLSCERPTYLGDIMSQQEHHICLEGEMFSRMKKEAARKKLKSDHLNLVHNRLEITKTLCNISKRHSIKKKKGKSKRFLPADLLNIWMTCLRSGNQIYLTLLKLGYRSKMVQRKKI